MKIKLPLKSLTQLFDSLANVRQAYSQLQRMAVEQDLLFADFNVGNGYLEWDLPGEGWTKFIDAPAARKSDIAEIYEQRKNALLSKLKGSFLSSFVFSVPSDDFIFFRTAGDKTEIALVAWGFRYPDRAPSGELETWIRKVPMQDVRLAFEWDGVKLPMVPFTVQGLQRRTSADGYFYFDRKLEVGSVLDMVSPEGQSFTLTVEQGKSDYITDMTKYFTAHVSVSKNKEPLPETPCEVEFNGTTKSITTDVNGEASIRIPLTCDIMGTLSAQQPACVVKCREVEQQAVPSTPGQILDFKFAFDTKIYEPPIVVIKEEKKEEKKEEEVEEPKKKKFPWWIFLCLLPLLLFIRCSKDVAVQCVEGNNQLEIAGAEVSLEYTSHFLWNNGRFFDNDTVRLVQSTDSTGVTVFKDLKCSVYSYIFYCLSKMTIGAKDGCYMSRDDEYNFHYRHNITLEMEPRREDLHVRLLDLETEDPLPDAWLVYRYHENDSVFIDSVRTNPDGVATIPEMRYCSDMELLQGQSYGYADTLRTDVPCKDLLVGDDSTALRLRPLKERFTFFVKNLDTKEPIPGAVCEVFLTHPSGKVFGPNIVTTSTDGKGIAIYEESFVLSVIDITAHKEHYNDSILTGGPWTVEEFIKQDDETRTIWLRPLPYVQEFINVDSITGKPVPGVTNIIRVINADGTETEYEEISNSNGVFPVEAKEDSKVVIISKKGPEYYDRHTEIEKFRDATDRRIPMRPETVTLKFRTINAAKPGVLVPNCTLQVSGSISGALPPSTSGSGEFNVTFRKVEYLSIKASRNNWVPTTDKVTNKNYEYLKEDQERRDIPMKQDLPPCNAGMNTPKGNNEMNHQRTYGMGVEEGNASIWVDFYSEPDHLKVVDGEGNVLINKSVLRKNEGGPNPIPFHFRGGSVTIIITTSSNNNSSWEYKLNCP